MLIISHQTAPVAASICMPMEMAPCAPDGHLGTAGGLQTPPPGHGRAAFVPKGLYLLAVSPPALLVVEEMPLCTGLGWAVWLTPAVGVMLGPSVAITPGRCCWCLWLGWCQSSLCDLGHAAWLP